MPPKLRKKKKSPTAPKEDINVGTSSKGIEKPEEIVSPFPREPSTVSMEGVESTEIAPSTKDREVTSTAPSVEEIKKWKRADVINFLQEKKEDLDIDDKHIQVIRDQEIAGQAFLRLTEEKLMRIGLTLGPAESIASLVETLKGGEVTLKRKYEESTENLTEIVKSAVREEFSRQKPDVISVSKLSETIMKKIMDDIGIKTAKLSVEDFLPLEPVSCEPFRWDIEQEEVQQMQDVEKWFKNVLSLPRNFHVKDVHKQVNFQRHLRGANTIITGGADIAVGPSETACVWIEIKKTLEDFKEGQAMGELFLIDKLHPTNAMTVLTDCNDNWIIYFFLKINEEQYMATSRIDDRSTALAIIRQFVLEEGQNFHKWIGKDIIYQVNLPAPLKKKTKFLESITETVDARMADMVGDMSEQELFNMTARKRLMLLRDYCRLDEQPQVDQLISQFSDNYENPPMMFA